MADENLQPVFQIQRVYLKDMSLEQPNSPAIFLEQEAPTIEVSLDVGAEASPKASTNRPSPSP
jgi:preprotein translocase subunit SecB